MEFQGIVVARFFNFNTQIQKIGFIRASVGSGKDYVLRINPRGNFHEVGFIDNTYIVDVPAYPFNFTVRIGFHIFEF